MENEFNKNSTSQFDLAWNLLKYFQQADIKYPSVIHWIKKFQFDYHDFPFSPNQYYSLVEILKRFGVIDVFSTGEKINVDGIYALEYFNSLREYAERAIPKINNINSGNQILNNGLINNLNQTKDGE